jgi:hypothetical protein
MRSNYVQFNTKRVLDSDALFEADMAILCDCTRTPWAVWWGLAG